jgi:hypothetical protein
MQFNNVDKNLPHTVILVNQPCRLDWLGNAGLGRGIYYVQGDLRTKAISVNTLRLMHAGVYTLKYVGPDEVAKRVEAEPQHKFTVVEPQAIQAGQEVVKVVEAGCTGTIVENDNEIVALVPDVEDTPTKRVRRKKTKIVEPAAADKIVSYEEDSSRTSQDSTESPSQDSPAG